MNPLTAIGLKALTIVVALGALLWGIHTLDQSRQRIGYDRRVAEDNTALIVAKAEALSTERALNLKLETARNEATIRNQSISRHAAAAGTANDRLRIALDTIRRSVPEDSASPSDQRTSTLAELFGDCASRYRELGEKADRHASDSRTLIESWPTPK